MTKSGTILRHGFTFTEVLFAVILLGIGFIMVAGMLPVATVQSQETMDQTIAAQVAKGAAEVLDWFATEHTMPQTIDTLQAIGNSVRGNDSWAPLWGFRDTYRYGDKSANTRVPDAVAAWQQVCGKMIHTADPRYAWTAVYSRQWKSSLTRSSPYAQVVIVVGRCRHKSRYDATDVQGPFPNLRLKDVEVKLVEGTKKVGNAWVPGPDTIEFSRPLVGDFVGIPTHEAAAEGAFVLMADDQQQATLYKPYANYSGSGYSAGGLANGRIYRVGNRRLDLGPNTFELMPGWDMSSGPGSGGPGADLLWGTEDDNQNIPIIPGRRAYNGRAYILGRAYKDPSRPQDGFEGPAQDVAVFTTHVSIK
mgnify:CR=1 FL=1